MMGAREAASSRPRLQRKLDRFGFFTLAFGSMLGVGWVTAMGAWLTSAGPIGAVIAFVVGGLLMLLIGLCYAEVTPMLPVAGGEVAYAYKAFGAGKSFVVGWFLAFGYISVSAFEAISIGRVVSFMFPGIDRWLLYRVDGDPVYLTHLLLALGCTVFITATNYIGVAGAAAVQKWLTGSFIAVTVVFIAAGFWTGDAANVQPVTVGGTPAAIVGGVLAVFVTVPFWFVGFDTIPQGAEEAEASIPARLLGTLIMWAIVGAVIFYVLLILSVSFTGPWQHIATADLPTARAFELAFQSTLMMYLVLIGALLGLFTSWNGFFLAGSRVLFSLGRGRLISSAFGEAHAKFGTPHRAVVFAGVITVIAPLLGRDALIAFVNVGSFCIAIAFLGVALTVIRLRSIAPRVERPYRVPGGLAIPRLAVGGALLMLIVMLLPGSPAALAWPLELAILVALTLLGAAFWIGGGGTRHTVSERDRAYLILEQFAEARGSSGGLS